MAKMDLGVKEKETITYMASDRETLNAFSGKGRWYAGFNELSFNGVRRYLGVIWAYLYIESSGILKNYEAYEEAEKSMDLCKSWARVAVWLFCPKGADA